MNNAHQNPKKNLINFVSILVFTLLFYPVKRILDQTGALPSTTNFIIYTGLVFLASQWVGNRYAKKADDLIQHEADAIRANQDFSTETDEYID